MSERREQCELMLSLLRERPMFSHELGQAGVGRPNSRAAQLRTRGHVITCEQRPEGYLYRLLGTREALVAAEAAAYAVPTESDRQGSSRDTAPAFPGGAVDELEEPTETAAAGSSSAVVHAPTCATRYVAQAACDCLAGLAGLAGLPLEETPTKVGAGGGVSSSDDPVCRVDVDAADLDEQLRFEQEYELLQTFGGDA